jgi:hypothetical protein
MPIVRDARSGKATLAGALIEKSARCFVFLALFSAFVLWWIDHYDISLYLRRIRLALFLTFPPYVFIQYCFIKMFGRPFRFEFDNHRFWQNPVEDQVADLLYLGVTIAICLVAHSLGVR